MAANAEEHFNHALVLALRARQGQGSLAAARQEWQHWAQVHAVGDADGPFGSENHHAMMAAGAAILFGADVCWRFHTGDDYWSGFLDRVEKGVQEMGVDCYGGWSWGPIVVMARWLPMLYAPPNLIARTRAAAGSYLADAVLGLVDFDVQSFVMECGPHGGSQPFNGEDGYSTSPAAPGPNGPSCLGVGNRGVFSGSAGWPAERINEMLVALALDWPGRKAHVSRLDVETPGTDGTPWSPAPVGLVLLAHGKPQTQAGFSDELPAESFGLTEEQRATLRDDPWSLTSLEICRQLTVGYYPRSGKTWLRVSPKLAAVIQGDDEPGTDDDRNSTKPMMAAMVSEPDARRIRCYSPAEYRSQYHVRARMWFVGLKVVWTAGAVPVPEQDEWQTGDHLRTITLPPGFDSALRLAWFDSNGLSGVPGDDALRADCDVDRLGPRKARFSDASTGEDRLVFKPGDGSGKVHLPVDGEVVHKYPDPGSEPKTYHWKWIAWRGGERDVKRGTFEAR